MVSRSGDYRQYRENPKKGDLKMATVSKNGKSAKAENFTEAQTVELRDGYLARVGYDDKRAFIAEFAAKHGKTDRSCIAKLSNLKVYAKKVHVTKTGGAVESKESLAGRIADALGVTAEMAESLTKANKAILQKLAEVLEAEPENG